MVHPIDILPIFCPPSTCYQTSILLPKIVSFYILLTLFYSFARASLALRKNLVHSFWLRFLLESYLDYLLTLFLHLHNYFKSSKATPSDTFSNFFVISGAAVYLALPIVVTIEFIRRPMQEIRNGQEKYGALYPEEVFVKGRV